MAAKPAKIATDLQPDTPLVQDAAYRFDATDRQWIDTRQRAAEQHLADSLLNGLVATWGMLDAGSAAVVAGQVVCSASTADGSVTLATSGALANAGSAAGVVLQGANPGGRVRYAVSGKLPPTITGLGAVAGYARCSTAGAVEYVASLSSGDYVLGTVDTAGNLTLGVLGAGVLGTVTSVGVTAPIVDTGTATAPVIGISAASGAAAGSMSAAHYALVAGATDANTASTIVKRDASGNFKASDPVVSSDVATKGWVEGVVNVTTGAATTGAGFAVEGVADDGSGLVEITATAHGLTTGDRVLVHGCGGVTLTATFDSTITSLVTVVDADHFTLDGSVFDGAYTAGGTVLRCTDILSIACPDDAVTEVGHLRFHVFKAGVGLAAHVLRLLIGVASGSASISLNVVHDPMDVDLGVMRYKIVGAADDGSGRIRLTTAIAHDLWTGDNVTVANVGGVPNATGTWQVERVDSTHVDLVGSTWGGAYTSIGWATPTFRTNSLAGAWAANVTTVWVIGHPTESLDWTARAYEVF